MKAFLRVLGVAGAVVFPISGCGPSYSVMQADENSVEIVAEISAQMTDVQPKADEMCAASNRKAVFRSSSCFDSACLEEVFLFICH